MTPPDYCNGDDWEAFFRVDDFAVGGLGTEIEHPQTAIKVEHPAFGRELLIVDMLGAPSTSFQSMMAFAAKKTPKLVRRDMGCSVGHFSASVGHLKSMLGHPFNGQNPNGVKRGGDPLIERRRAGLQPTF